jgi:hypothetical protein
VLATAPSSETSDRESPIILELALAGNLRPRRIENGTAIEFITPGGIQVLRYGDLYAHDAAGRPLSAYLRLAVNHDATQADRRSGARYAIRILLDSAAAVFPITIGLLACVSEVNNEVYFWTERQLLAVDLDAYAERAIADVDPRMPLGLLKSRAAPTADGKCLVAQLMEDLPQEQAGISYSYSRFRETDEKRPLSQIVRIEIDTGKQEVIHEDRRYLGHVNTSPTQPDLLPFCHEGPWNLVDSPRSVGRASRAWTSNPHASWGARRGRCARRRAKPASGTSTGSRMGSTATTGACIGSGRSATTVGDVGS